MIRSDEMRCALFVFLLLCGAYLTTSSFRIDTIDTGVRLEVARSLVRDGTPAISSVQMQTPFGVVGSFPGRDGRFYSVYGLGQSLLMMPIVAVAGDHDEALVTLINLLAVAATAALLVLLSVRLGFSSAAGTRLGLLFGLATLAWPQSKFTFEAPLEMLAGTVAMFSLARSGGRSAFVAGLAFAFALVLRPSALVMAPALVWLAWRGDRPGPRLLAFAGGLAPGVVVMLGYNAYRWGSPFSIGYSHTSFQYLAWQWEGLVGLLLSPGRGFFWFSPVLLLAPFAFAKFRHRCPNFAVAAVLFAGSYLGFLSFVTVWNGDWTWGPRHLLPVVPVVALLMLPLLEPGAIRRTILVPLVVLSVAVQLVGVSLSYETYFLWHLRWMRTEGVPERAGEYHFHASRSQIYVQLRQAMVFFSGFDADAALPAGEPGPYAPVLQGTPAVTKRVPDLWWVYFPLAGVLPAGTVTLGLGCAALLLTGAWGLGRGGRGSGSEP